MAKNYWEDRTAKAQAELTNKNIEQTQKQLTRYYRGTQQKVIKEFEATYNKLLTSIGEGKQPTPADLYKLDTYWKMQAQLRDELQKLGDQQAATLSKNFIEEYQAIYNSMAIKDGVHFNHIDTDTAKQMINQIWCADGMTWSNRVWKNTDLLQQTLNDRLIECVVAGKKTTELKNLLLADFDVAYNRADTLVRTEMAHIQTQAAKDRYKDEGITEIEVWADADERRCDVCGELHKKRFPINAKIPIPAHPRCRCCILPVVDNEVPNKIERLGYKEDPQPQNTPLPQENSLTLKEDYSKMNLEKFIGMPIENISGDNVSIRKWYYANVHNIPNLIDKTLSLEQQAQQAFTLRNSYKIQARRAMLDEESAKWLDSNRPVPTIEQLIKHKMKKYGMTEQEALEDIIRSASTTNSEYDKKFLGG